MPHQVLIQEIINLSTANTWQMAKLEWALKEIFESEEMETCLCGHYPIKELCIIGNRTNGNTTTVGNCCVKKFMGLPSDKIFRGIKRIRQDIDKSLNIEAINYAFQRKVINKWEHDFYCDIMRKRNLTDRQYEKKIEINQKLLNNIRKVPPAR